MLFGTNCYILFHAFSKITLYFVMRLSSTTSSFLVVLRLQYAQHFHPRSLCNDKPPEKPGYSKSNAFDTLLLFSPGP